jgi:hypothetical protein
MKYSYMLIATYMALWAYGTENPPENPPEENVPPGFYVFYPRRF